MKCTVYQDGNGGSTINVMGFGVYVPVHEFQKVERERNALAAQVENLTKGDWTPEQYHSIIKCPAIVTHDEEITKSAFIAGVEYKTKRPDVVLPKVIQMVADDYFQRTQDNLTDKAGIK